MATETAPVVVEDVFEGQATGVEVEDFLVFRAYAAAAAQARA